MKALLKRRIKIVKEEGVVNGLMVVIESLRLLDTGACLMGDIKRNVPQHFPHVQLISSPQSWDRTRRLQRRGGASTLDSGSD
jgi:hypothetical protein